MDSERADETVKVAYNGPMEQKQHLGIVLLAVMLAFFIGFVFGHQVETRASQTTYSPGAPSDVNMDPVWRAWWLLDEKFVSSSSSAPLSAEERVWGIIAGLANSYNDPYTLFLPPQASKSFDEELSGAFGGVGIEIGMRDGILTVIAPLKGTPADLSGIRAGDLILEVDGISTQNMSIDDAVSTIRGEVGSSIEFTIAREGEQEFLTIEVVRDTIKVPTLDSELRSDGVFVISLYNFGGTAVDEMRNALRSFVQTGSDKLILDLRGNPGGFVDAAINTSSWFLEAGKVILIEDFGDEQERIYHRSTGRDITQDDWNIVVLVDGGSASASEIVAGALREHGKAVVMGEQTFGKGSVQELVQVTPETSLKITVAQWLTPNGITISDGGLTPDYVIELQREDIEAGRDPQMDTAVQYLLTGVFALPAAASTTDATGLEAGNDLE